MKSVVFVGQAYYNAWVLKNSLKAKAWNTKLIDIDPNLKNRDFYHGYDEHLYIPDDPSKDEFIWQLEVYLNTLISYEIFHFSNQGGIYFLKDMSNIPSKAKIDLSKLWYFIIRFFLVKVCQKSMHKVYRYLRLLRIIKVVDGRYIINRRLQKLVKKIYISICPLLARHWEIYLIKALGKKITYAHNGCQDGVSQTSFSKWGPFNSCSICAWSKNKDVCSDEKNLKWGKFRNSLADVQFTTGGNRVDYNLTSSLLEVPEFYCLDETHWKPLSLVPSNYLLNVPRDTFKIYHSVGNYATRSDENGVNIKCTHIYEEVIRSLKNKGFDVELVFVSDVKNEDVRLYLTQADIVVDMLTFGFFGANVREALMMGKPTICYLRPEWLNQISEQKPDYVNELPVISATPETVELEIQRLIEDKEYYRELSAKSREFALKYHSSYAGREKLDQIFSELLDQ